MKKLGLNEIREKFLDYFKTKEHLTVRSYPLIPADDKSLLFIVAGMVPLKNYFAGVEEPPKTRMATSQKCIRTNDIDNVGHTARHASYFEMLGNFSFGDYFKREAIDYAWEFSTKVLELPKEKIWVTIYEEDDEAFEIWNKEVGLPEDKIVRLGKKDNFWEIGSGTGPCGPCSELYFDRGLEYGCGCADCKPGCDCDRFLEYWNLVFTQFDKQPDGSLLPLAHPNIDTGMGLERISCIMQGVSSIYDVDVFRTILQEIEAISGKKYGANPKDDVSMRIITDHIRAVTFVVSEGVTPDNEGRGYVLRMLFRRAARHGKLLGIDKNFMARLASKVVDVFGPFYHELAERRDFIMDIVNQEEDRFNKTLDSGLKILDGYIDELEEKGAKVLKGEFAFKLYDTYGFPLDLTRDILRDGGYSVDEEGFKKAMEEQRIRARNARNSSESAWDLSLDENLPSKKSEFCGYDRLSMRSKVEYITKMEDESLHVVFDKTPFYATSGGQVEDGGRVFNEGFEAELLSVKKLAGGQLLHELRVTKGELKLGDEVETEVDRLRRFDTMKNHTATHLLHSALKQVIGNRAQQAGSYVDSERLRFDFTHSSALTKEELVKVEGIVNQKIYEQIEGRVQEMPIDEAMKLGAQALFGEKYSDIVRVVSYGDYSIELCGGTHVSNTKDIGIFKIMSETALAAGVRRIEAITGRKAYEYLTKLDNRYSEIRQLLKVQDDGVIAKVSDLLAENKELHTKVKELKAELLSGNQDDILKEAKVVNSVLLITKEVEGVSQDELRNLADDLANRPEATLVALATREADKVKLVIKCNKPALDKGLHSGKLIKELAAICGGSGGGRPDMAMAGGTDASKISEAFKSLENLI